MCVHVEYFGGGGECFWGKKSEKWGEKEEWYRIKKGKKSNGQDWLSVFFSYKELKKSKKFIYISAEMKKECFVFKTKNLRWNVKEEKRS